MTLTRRHFVATALSVAALPTAVLGHAGLPHKTRDSMRSRPVDVRMDLPVGSVHIFPQHFALYHVRSRGQAQEYHIAVGEQGRNMRGGSTIQRKAEWPSWTPTANMIRREPETYRRYAGGMPGGPDNPLGARALYLYRGGRDTMYRIHGTHQPWSIGMAASSGCIRLTNDDVIDLYPHVTIGSRVISYA